MNALAIKSMRLLVNTLGRLSDGISIARRDGLTSGKMVDYVYRNRASGRWLIGRLIDRIYLSNNAWRAVRVRKRNLAELLAEAIEGQLALQRTFEGSFRPDGGEKPGGGGSEEKRNTPYRFVSLPGSPQNPIESKTAGFDWILPPPPGFSPSPSCAGVLATGAAAPAEAVVLDIASGPGQYLMDTLARFSGRPVRAICWDLDDRWLAEGRRSAQRMGFGPLNTVTFARADALAADSFVSLVCRPNIVVASGFYDWMDDPTIRRSMGLVFDALPADGRFVFTHQTGHACIEMVNQVFTHFDGQPLRMATRPAAMVHDWARQAGFRIERSAADSQSYYTATLARKV